jgi:hypothetical protein
MKRITRKQWLTPEEAEKQEIIRAQIEAELPELIARHHERMKEREEKENKNYRDNGGLA